MQYRHDGASAKGSFLEPEATTRTPLPGARSRVEELARARDEHARGQDEAAVARLEALLDLTVERPAGVERPAQAADARTVASAWSLYGRVLDALGREDAALAAFRRAVADFDRIVTATSVETGQVRSDYGRALFRIDELVRAAEELKRAIELDYHTLDTLKYLGLALATREPDEAIHHLERALSLRPDDVDIRLALALLRRQPEGFIALGHHQRRNGNPDAALEQYRVAILFSADRSDERAEAQVALGSTLISVGRAAEAIEPLQEATSNALWGFRGYTYLAEALRLLGKPTDALAAIDHALELDRDAYSLGTKGQILVALGDPAEAIRWLRYALDLDPSAEWALSELLPLLRQAGDLTVAEQYLRRLTTAGGSTWSFGQLADLLVEMKRRDDAIEILLPVVAANFDPSLAARLVAFLRAEDRPEEALRQLETFTAAAPDSAWAFRELGETLRLLERYDEALAALDRAIELEPQSAYALGTKGQVLRKRGKLAEARRCLDLAVAIDGTMRWVKEELVMLTSDTEGPEAAIALIDKWLVDDPAWDRGHARRGAALRSLGRLTEARPSLEEAVRLDPKDLFSVQELGECLRGLGLLDEALATFDRALAIDPNSAFALASKAALLLSRDAADEALALSEKAHEIDSDNVFAIRIQAVALRVLKRSDEAVGVLQEALIANVDDVGLLGELGETLRVQDREEDALEILDRALSVKPDDSYCRAARGYSLRTLDRYEDALDDLRRAVTIEPDYAWAHVALAHVLLDIADLPAAHEHAVRGWELDPTQVWARGIEAFVKALLGDLPGARDAMQDAHERDPEELNWTQLLADMHTALGDRSGAQALYREVVERGSDATVLDTIARVGWSHRWLGEHDKAVRMYQRALSLGRRRPHYLRLDFALALLCGGQSELADHEYQRALRDIGGLSPIRVRGLLHVALYDLDLAIREMLRGEHATADRVRQLLADALATSQRSAGNAEPVPSVGASA